MSHILIVDDEEPVRHTLRRMIERQGYRISEAESAEDALDRFNEEPVDLVVTDLNMPDHDGLWLAQQLLERDPDLPVILATGYADLGSAQRAVGVGVYEYFIKPLDLHQVMTSIGRGLELRRLTLENRAYQKNLEAKVEARTRDLERAYQELIQSEKLTEVGRLAAGVVHEVLNPLSVVLGRIELVLAGDALTEFQRRSLMIACEQIQRAVRIMDNLRSFSRQHAPVHGAVDVNESLGETLELFAYELRNGNIAVETDFGAIPQIRADRDQLSQVFLNLVKNALEAMPGGGRLRLVTGRAESGDDIAVQVIDSGEGIAEENMARIFDLFFTTKKKGTGLGLGICRGIVEAHGGTLTVESAPGQGANFRILLPIKGRNNTDASVFAGGATPHLEGGRHG